jgi:hypothetical protein
MKDYVPSVAIKSDQLNTKDIGIRADEKFFKCLHYA